MCREELVSQIDGYRVVPRLRSDIRDFVSGVVTGVVYQNVDHPKAVNNIVDRALESWDVGQVTVIISRRIQGRLQSRDKTAGLLVLQIRKQA